MKSNIKAQQAVSRSVAEQSLPRALQFLRTVGTDASVRAAMQQTGFGAEDMKHGWTLVLTACSAPVSDLATPALSGPVVEATKKLETWQSVMFPRAQAALGRLHPEQEAFLFENLSITSSTAVVNVSIFLNRCDALESGSERKATRKADHAALETMSKRGITETERKQARHLVNTIEIAPAPEMVANNLDVRANALAELHAWVQDWSACARTVIARRDQLIRMGIGKRRAPKSATAPTAPATVQPAQPPVAPAPTAPAQLTQSTSLLALPAPAVNGVNKQATHA